MWPYMQEKPECIKDPNPAAGLARSWTATLSAERLPYSMEMRQAIRQVAIGMEHAHTEYGGLWILCDEHGTWVILTYTTAKEPQVAARNLRQILKPLGKDVLDTMEKTRRYFNESHQARIEQLKIRRDIIYKAERTKVTTTTKPKACKQNLSQWVAYHRDHDDDDIKLALAIPVPRDSNTNIIMSPYQDSIIRFMDEAEHINNNLQKLTEARNRFKKERDELNELGGDAESPQHLEYEAKHLQVVAHNQAIKQAQTEHKDIQAKITSMNEDKDNIVEECDEDHADVYAMWLLGDTGYLPPPAQIFIKSMREEKDREKFLITELEELPSIMEILPIQEQSLLPLLDSGEAACKYSTGPSIMVEVLNASVKKTKQLQDECIFPKDANSHDRARTRKRIANVCVAMTGETPDAKRINKMLDKQDGCQQCGGRGVTLYCKQGGGLCFLIEKAWEEDCLYSIESNTGNSYSDGIVKLCSERCYEKYRVQPVCKRCNNEDMTQMYKHKQTIEGNDYVILDWMCKHCRVPCESRDPGVWRMPARQSIL